MTREDEGRQWEDNEDDRYYDAQYCAQNIKYYTEMVGSLVI